MTRRAFITLLGGAVAAWPLVASAQQPMKVPTIGFLGSGTPMTAGQWVAAFAQRLRELGWIEDRTIKIDLRWAEGRNDRSVEIASESVRLNVDVIVTYSSEHAHIVKLQTTARPARPALFPKTRSPPAGPRLAANMQTARRRRPRPCALRRPG
jgi:hypothetical protein